jgi:DNA ligase (NAD+)
MRLEEKRGGRMTADKRHVEDLARQLIHHKRVYYAGKPEISDERYDALEEELRKLSPGHPVLQAVGSDDWSGGVKVEHDTPMLSLQKVYTEKELFAWMRGEELVGSWKVDGNSLSVVYRDGSLTLAKTRGNGRVGEEVTAKVLWVEDLPPSVPVNFDFEVRGELYCNEANFALLVAEMERLNLERPTNPRNIVAGLLGRKTHIELARFIRFFAFDVIVGPGGPRFRTEWDKIEWLEKNGFSLPNVKLLKDEDSVQTFLGGVKDQIGNGDINIDGAVFSYNDVASQEEVGFTSHHPRFKMSFKWQGQTAVGVIRRIHWSTSRLGIVTPVAVIDPVALSGAMITNVTLHNAEHIRTHNLKAGDEIKIVRSGEVIPKFIQVEKAAEGSYVFPNVCPSCNTKLEFDEIRLKCPNQTECPAQLSRTILNWIQNAGIDDLSDKRLEQMLQMGLVKEIPDLYRLSVEDFLRLPLTHDKMANKLYGNIQKSKNLPLPRFLSGLGIEGAGHTTWEKLLEHFPSLDDLLAAKVEDIENVSGFAAKSANQIAHGLETRKDLIRELLEVGVKPVATELSSGDGIFNGQHIAITGKLSRPRAEIEKMIRLHGGRPASAVSSNTAALISNETDSNSSKMKKAKALGIPVWTEDEFLSKLEE